MFPLDVLAEGHLQQRQSHVKRFHDVGLARQRVVPGKGNKIILESFLFSSTYVTALLTSSFPIFFQRAKHQNSKFILAL